MNEDIKRILEIFETCNNLANCIDYRFMSNDAVDNFFSYLKNADYSHLVSLLVSQAGRAEMHAARAIPNSETRVEIADLLFQAAGIAIKLRSITPRTLATYQSNSSH